MVEAMNVNHSMMVTESSLGYDYSYCPYSPESCSVHFPLKTISHWVDLSMWGLCLVSLLLGLPLHLTLVHYEWYGGDSQKRSLGNRIISQCAIANLIFGCFNFVTVVSSRYGFVGGMARQAIYRFEGIFLNAFVWFSNVYAVYRFFQVVIWKRVMEINEGLVMRFLTLSVYLMSTSISWLFVQGFRFNSMSSAVTGQIAHVTLASCYTEHPFQQRSVIHWFLIPAIALNLIVFLIIRVNRSITTPEIVQDVDPNNSHQTQRYNRSMQDVTSPYYILCFCLEFGLMAAFGNVKAGDLESYVVMWTVYTLNHLLILPGIFLCLANREARDYVKRIISNFVSRRQNAVAPSSGPSNSA